MYSKITNTVNSMMCCRMLSSRAHKMATAMSYDASRLAKRC